MRVRVTTTLALTAAASLLLPACSPSGAAPVRPSHSPAGPHADASRPTAPLSSAALEARLLTESDLGIGYQRKPDRAHQAADTTVHGCPALSALGSEAATVSLDFPHRAKTAFTTSGSAEFSEELYSNGARTLAESIARIFDAMTGCPTYEVGIGGASIGVTTRPLSAPKLGDRQWSLQLTYAAGGQRTALKQTAVLAGNVLVVVAGSPELVDAHLAKAVGKARTSR
ncbi:hypothetical protein ACFYVL_09135 [Streptomyces sp. NPDC004111]|uniref:hypothetical protein n=1 Tax=Streptomyces sp. NPDC004111 TaxID=3364690 RepID=UPI0036B744D7